MTSNRQTPLQRARAFAAHLEVDPWQGGVCLLCLSFVTFPLDNGEEREAVSAARRMTPEIWDDGLEPYALAVVREARATGVPGAEEALADLTLNGGRSVFARALVLRLAEVEAQRIRREHRIETAARPRLALAPPELN